MFLHITAGDKFEHYAARQFEDVRPGGNRFVAVLAENSTSALSASTFRCETVGHGSADYASLLRDVAAARCVIFHGFHTQFVEIFNHCATNCVTAWVYWGFEVHGAAGMFFKTLLPHSRDYYVRSISDRRFILRNSRRLVGPLISAKATLLLSDMRRAWRQRTSRRALRQFDFVLTYIDEEVALLRRAGLSRATPLPFCYYSLRETIGERYAEMRVTEHDVLLGNSATLTGNHLDALEQLRLFDLRGRRVLCPLAYGDVTYARAVVEAGERLLGTAFKPITRFVPIYEHNQNLQRCSAVIMNHVRQQAMGNIITSLWLGAKVYLREGTTVWSYLRRIGIRAYSIQRELRPGDPSALDAPPQSIVERNRRVLEREFSYEAALQRSRATIEGLEGRLARDPQARTKPER